MNIDKLTEVGLTDTEAIIYGSLLKLGTGTVRDISKDCGFHRTNIYDVLEQLKEKGLASISKQGKTTIYSASDPENLSSLLKEKQEILSSILPELNKTYARNSEDLKVEVFKGMEGMKTTWRDMIKEAKPIYGYGVKGQLRDKLPLFAEQWMRDAKNKKIKYYGIYTERGNTPSFFTEIKYVSKELSGPVATMIYGDKVNINIWDPDLMAIVIKSKLVAEMFKKHFDLLWRIAKK